MSRLKNRIGERHGRLKVIRYQGNRRWLTVCDCGYARTFTSQYLHHARACGHCDNVRATTKALRSDPLLCLQEPRQKPLPGHKPLPHYVELTARDRHAVDLWHLCGDFHVVPPITEPDTPAPPSTGRGSQAELQCMLNEPLQWRLPT